MDARLLSVVERAARGRAEPLRDGAFVPGLEDLYAFAAERRLDEADLRDWWEWVTNGRGEPPARSWQGSAINFCARRRREREAARTDKENTHE